MKFILFIILFLIGGILHAQTPVASNSCDQAQNICNSIPVPFPLTTGPSPNPTVPPSGSFSNPNNNPQGVNSGCLFSQELNPNWFVLNVTSTGPLEFQIGQPGGSGYFDWELWPYNPTTGCTDIANNLVAPVSCNWNASSAGFTGMSNGSTPPGGVAGNFQPSINVVAGEAYILMFSNYSGLSGVVNLTFPPAGATIGCSGGTPDQTICQGDTAIVDLLMSPAWVNATANWLVTTNVSDVTGITGVLVNPPVTTQYQVEIWDQGSVVDTINFTIFVENPPTPNAGPDQNVCFGTPIQLAGTQSNPTNTLLWTYSAVGISPPPAVNFSPNFQDPNAVVTVNQLGTYDFYLTETNSTCGAVTDTVQVTVSDLVISATSVSPSCIGLSDGQIHIDSPGAIEYSFDNGTTWQVDSFNLTLPAGTYDVCARTSLGCTECTQVTITDPAPVTVSVSNDTTICQNGTGYLSATATGGTSYNFHWGFTNDLNPNQTVTPVNTGYYTVYAENQNGCISLPDSILVTVLPPISGTISPFDTVCPTYSTDILATAGGGIGQPYTFTWSTGDVFTGAGNDQINVTPTQTTTYTVTITDGCESTPLVLTTDVRVAPLPVPTYLVTNPIQCEPAEFEIVNTTDATMSEFVYWEVDGIPYLNQDTITSQQLMAGDYDIFMLVTSYEGCVDSILYPNALHVDPLPEALFHFSPDPVTMFNTDVSFLNYSYNGDTYQWYFPGGTPAQSTEEDVEVRYPDGVIDSYDVTLITTSALGCVDTLVKTIVVNPEVILYAPNTFTPDGDEFNQSWEIHIEGVDIYNFELFIFNRWGEVIWESHDPSVGWDGTYKGKIVPQGTYSWIIRVNDILNDDKHTFSGYVNIIR